MCNIEIINIPEFYVQNFFFAYIRYFKKKKEGIMEKNSWYLPYYFLYD